MLRITDSFKEISKFRRSWKTSLFYWG